jgi:hypothetical protein
MDPALHPPEASCLMIAFAHIRARRCDRPLDVQRARAGHWRATHREVAGGRIVLNFFTEAAYMGSLYEAKHKR